MSLKERIAHFSREGKHSRIAKLNLKRILFRIAMPNGISLEEKITIESIVDNIISARLETQVRVLEEFQRRSQNEMIEIMKEEKEEIRKMVTEMLKSKVT